MLQQIGKIILLAAAGLAVLGAVLYLLGRLGITRLPGDISLGGKNWRVYLPIGTSILLSILLTLALYILNWLRR